MSDPKHEPNLDAFTPNEDDAIPGWRVAIVVIGLVLFALIYMGIPIARIFVKPLPPDPEPVLNITATWGDLDEICLYQYYSLDDYPENPARRGLLIDYDNLEYICLEANGLCSTNRGDCWEAVYRVYEK